MKSQNFEVTVEPNNIVVVKFGGDVAPRLVLTYKHAKELAFVLDSAIVEYEMTGGAEEK